MVKKLNLNAIRIDGGTHRNYVVQFEDGACKIGVTSRPQLRVMELQRQRGRDVRRVMFAPATDRETAYRLERDLCQLARRSVVPGTREWHVADAEFDQFDYLRQTTGMFWHLIARREYAPEVIAC